MNWYRCIGGNGSSPTPTPVVPQFTKTLIMDNTALSDTLTFTDDYTTYDFLEFEWYNIESTRTTIILTTSEIVEEIFLHSNGLFNASEHSNQYGSYRKTSSTVWTLDHGRNMRIKMIRGVNCTNATVEKTWIYKHNGYTGGEVTITTTGLLSYDYILTSGFTGTADETCISLYLTVPKTIDDINVPVIVSIYGGYYLTNLTDTTMSASKYFAVQGIKFT